MDVTDKTIYVYTNEIWLILFRRYTFDSLKIHIGEINEWIFSNPQPCSE